MSEYDFSFLQVGPNMLTFLSSCYVKNCYPTGGLPARITENVARACVATQTGTAATGAVTTSKATSKATSASVTAAATSTNAGMALGQVVTRGVVNNVLPVFFGFLAVGLGAGAVFL